MSDVLYRESAGERRLTISHRPMSVYENIVHGDEGQENLLHDVNIMLDETRRIEMHNEVAYDVTGVTLYGLHLHKFMFSYVKFVNCAFTDDTSWSEVSFRNCTFEACTFENCFFRDCKFMSCTLTDTQFLYCVLLDCKVLADVYSGAYFMKNSICRDAFVTLTAHGETGLYLNNFMHTKLDLQDAKFVLKNNSFSRHSTLYLCNESLEHNIQMTCPSTGSFTAYKCAWYDMPDGSTTCAVLVTLLIPEDALRGSALGRKCRASKAQVVSIVDKDGGAVEIAYSAHDSDFFYHVGDTVEPEGKQFEENRFCECASGIHFFMSAEEAWEYAKESF